VSLAAPLQEELDFFYWQTKVGVGEIARAFNIPGHEVWLNATPLLVGRCACGQPLHARNREQARNATHRRYRQFPPCPVCTERWKAEVARQVAARDARRAQLRSMPYREYLQTPEWQEIRRQAVRRTKGHCQLCNASRVRLNVHHRTYENRGAERYGDLIVLCEDCHGTFHAQRGLHR
jgi:5-methylcytosine-specific restriction endonuclease McrA